MIPAVNPISAPQVDRAPPAHPHLAHWARRLLRWCAPMPCLVCRERTGLQPVFEGLCPACLAELPWNLRTCPAPKHLHHLHAACTYHAPLDRLLPRFKFQHDLAAGRLLAQLLLHTVHTASRPDALVAVPLHPSRLRRRGYDQALELARPLARALGLPLISDGLIRTRATAAQSELDASARKRNLHAAFAAQNRQWPPHIALIDDVMTTGATLSAAARALRQTGVKRVDGWVCAWVP